MRIRHLRVIAIAAVVAIACGGADTPGQQSATPPTSRPAAVNAEGGQNQPRLVPGIDDVLGRYPVDELREYLARRRQKALHKKNIPELDKYSDAALIDYIQRKQKTIYGADSRKDISEVRAPRF